MSIFQVLSEVLSEGLKCYVSAKAYFEEILNSNCRLAVFTKKTISKGFVTEICDFVDPSLYGCYSAAPSSG